jgi:hypothetical protein
MRGVRIEPMLSSSFLSIGGSVQARLIGFREAAGELILEGVRHDVRLINISESGARLHVAAHCSIGTRGELRIPGHRLSVPGRVVASDGHDDAVSLAFAAPIELPATLRGSHARAA